MYKDKLVAEMLTAKAENNNTIDLDTYANGLADMYDRLVNLCNLPVVSGSYYYLKKGDEIKRGDEYQEQDGDNSWRITGQTGKNYNPSKHYRHRRLR